jgi:nucleoside-diphosphate-sugar epimerase
MKILVTGINGRLGKAIAGLAEGRGHSIIGVCRRGWNEAEPLPAGVTVHAGDTADADRMGELMQGCDAFVHTSGLHSAHLKTHSLADFLDVNVTQVGTLLLKAKAAGISRVCLSSTLQVHCGYDQCASGSMIFEESMPSRADTPYSLSKHLMEELGVEMARMTGLSIVSLRLGAFGYLPDDKLGVSLLNLAITSTDAARAVFHAVERGGFAGEAVIIAPAVPISQSDLVAGQRDPQSVLEKYYPGASEILTANGQTLTPSRFSCVSNIRRAEALLGWKPTFTFGDWLKSKGWVPPVV